MNRKKGKQEQSQHLRNGMGYPNTRAKKVKTGGKWRLKKDKTEDGNK